MSARGVDEGAVDDDDDVVSACVRVCAHRIRNECASRSGEAREKTQKRKKR